MSAEREVALTRLRPQRRNHVGRKIDLRLGRRDQPTRQDKEDPMARTHQPGEAVFKSVLPEDIDWKPFPAFPPSVRLAVLVGQPSEPGPYLIRVKVPAGEKL